MIGKKSFSDVRYLMAAINPLTTKISMKEDLMGMSLKAYKWDVVGRSIFKTGMYDPFLSRWLIDRFAAGGGRFVDIGANLGYFTCLLGQLAGPYGRVLSVEPEPDNLELLEANVAINELAEVVKILPVALGSDEGSATLNLYKNSNRGRHSMVAVGSGNQIEVPIKKLDTLIEQVFQPHELIDFVKIDVEGYEPYVIKGASQTLPRVQSMVMEYAPYILKNAGADLPEFLCELGNHFSKIYRIEEASLVKTDIEEILRQESSVDLLYEK
jgi:FkbM family methyltransferase